MQTQPPPSLPALTAVRGLAAWWVVLYHFRDEVPRDVFGNFAYRIIAHGDLAVDFFFVLSGFIIALNYSKAFRKLTPKAYIDFMIARFARIYPLHLFTLVMFLLSPVAIMLWSTEKQVGDRYDITYFLLSLVMVQNWGFTSRLAWNIPAWSISTEWLAYILFPLNVLLLNRFGSTAMRAAVLAAAMLVLMVACCYAFGFSLGSDIARFGLARCLFEFAAGVALQRVWQESIRHRSWYAFMYMTAAIGSIALYAGGLAPDFVVLPAAFCLIILALASDTFLSRILSIPILIGLGELSYSTYLSHYLIKDWIKFIFGRSWMPPELLLILYLVTIAAASVALYFAIEVPSRRAIRAWANERRSAHGYGATTQVRRASSDD